MTAVGALQSLAARGESETLEIERSTASLTQADETLDASLSAKGRTVLIGVGADGRLVGQRVVEAALGAPAATVDAGLVELKIAIQPRSSTPQYRITQAGRAALAPSRTR